MWFSGFIYCPSSQPFECFQIDDAIDHELMNDDVSGIALIMIRTSIFNDAVVVAGDDVNAVHLNAAHRGLKLEDGVVAVHDLLRIVESAAGRSGWP